MIKWRLQIIEAHLNNRNISVGIQAADNAPAAMIKSPCLIETNLSLSHAISDLPGNARAPWSRIIHFEKLLRKTSEIVYRLGFFHGCDMSSSCFPVCRNAKDSGWTRKSLADISPSLHKFIFLDSVHRA